MRLHEDEGGLNLGMDSVVITKMIAKGTRAGEVLADDFRFDHHRWVRFLVLMKMLEENLHRLREGELGESYALLLANVEPDFPYGAERGDAWEREAAARLHDLLRLSEKWHADDGAWNEASGAASGRRFFAPGAPTPDPVLRVTPPD